jgi:hypothetical protein
MELMTQSTLPPDLDPAFRGTLTENVFAVHDGLRVIAAELDEAGEANAARFFERVAGVIRLFWRGWSAGQEH